MLFLILISVLRPLLLPIVHFGGELYCQGLFTCSGFFCKGLKCLFFFLFVLQNKASLQMAHTRFLPSLCPNHKCLTPDSFSTVSLVFLQWLLKLSCLSVELWQDLMGRKEEGRKEDKLLVQNSCMEQPSRPSGWPFPSTGRLMLDPLPQSP